MKLSTRFTRGVVTASPDAPLSQVAAMMKNRNVGAVVVEEQMRPVGIVTDRDLALALGANGYLTSTPVREIMTRHVLAVPDTTDIFTATKYMKERHVRRLPIVDKNDRLIGMVTLDDLLSCLGQELFNLAESINAEMDVNFARKTAQKESLACRSADADQMC